MEVAPLRFLALGDSYSVGESVPPADAWPRQLAERLGKSGRPVEVTVIATTAWTSGELLAAVDADTPEGVFDLVSIQVGVNDQYRGLALEDFAANAVALLTCAGRLRGGGPGGLMTVSIPDWGVTPFAAGRDRSCIAEEIDRFNAVWERLASIAMVPFVDVTTISRRHPGELADDGLHPSASQYRRWVEALAPVAEAVLARDG